MERAKFKTNNISKEITENDIIENITDICVKQNLTIEATHKFRSKRVIGYALINSVNHCFKFKKPRNLLMYIKIIDEHKSDDLLSYGFYKAQRDISINFFIDEQKIKNITVIINEKNLNYIYEYISFILTHLRKSSMINFDDLETVQKDFFDEYGEIDKEGNITYEKPFTKVRCNNIMYPLDRYSVGCNYPARCINSILFNDGKAIEIKHSNSVDIISISNFKNHFDAIVDENGNIIPNNNKDEDNNSENTEFTKVKFINKLESTPYLNSILEIGNYYYVRWNNNKKIIIIYEQPNRRLSPKGVYSPKLFQESFDAKIDENGNIIPNKENKEGEKEDMTTYRMRNTIKDLPRTVTVLCTKTLETKAQLYPAGQYFYAYADEDDIIYIDGKYHCCCPISKDKFLNHFDAEIDKCGKIIPNEYIHNIVKMICIEDDKDKEIHKKYCYYVDFSKIFNNNEFKCWDSKYGKNLSDPYKYKLISEDIIYRKFKEIISIEVAVKIIQYELDLKPSEILKCTDTIGDDTYYLKYQGDIITLDTNSLANPEYYSVFVSIATNDETHRFATRNVYLTNKTINELCDFITFLNPRLNQETVKDDTL